MLKTRGHRLSAPQPKVGGWVAAVHHRGGPFVLGPTDPFNRNRSLKKRRETKRKSPYDKMVIEYKRARERAFYGSLGGASPVRRIDPKTGKVVEVLDPETGAVLPKRG